MSMKQVQVLEATKAAPNSNGRRTAGIQIERIRVAAYCRVSTDGDEQLGSFESQKAYYEQKIKHNKEWVSAGIFADEAITGTKVDKREFFNDNSRMFVGKFWRKIITPFHLNNRTYSIRTFYGNIFLGYPSIQTADDHCHFTFRQSFCGKY